MFAVDTNIFVYAHFDQYQQHGRARRFCRSELLGEAEFCIGWQVVYEYIRIATHPRVHRHPLAIAEALADMEPYLASDRCHVLVHTPQHGRILEDVAARLPAAAGNLVHDCHYAALLREHGIKVIYTADNDFRRFGFLEVVDPTSD